MPGRGSEQDRPAPPAGEVRPDARGPGAEETAASATHDLAVLRQDNGELAEDAMPKRTLDAADAATAHHAADDEADQQSEESFPASDAPSTWAGDGPTAADPRHGDVAGRLVDRSPVEHVPERDDPDDPVPRTLPRDGRST